MFQILAQVSSLLAGTALLMVGSSLLSMLLPLSMEQAGFSTELTGFMMASYYGGLMLGCLYSLRLILMVGHIRAFAGLAAIVAAVVLTHPMAFSPWIWMFLRLVVGFCLAGLFAVMESWLNERASNETRGQLLSVYLMTQYLSLTAGQMMVNLWEITALEPYMTAAILVCLSLVPVVLTRERAPDLKAAERLGLVALFRISPLGVVGTFCSGLLMGGFYGLGAVYGNETGFDVLEISLFVSSLVIGGFLLQFPIGRLSDIFDRRTVMVVALLFGVMLAAGGVALRQTTDNIWYFMILTACLGGPMTAVYPLSVGQAFDYLPKEKYVAASGGLLMSYAIGATLGPIAISFAMSWTGPDAFFGFHSSVSLLLAAFVLFRMRRRAALPAREQEVFKPLPAVSPVALELDPRANKPLESKAA